MKTKTIPFDLETAKKIQAGEIEGKIITEHGDSVRVICWDRLDKTHPIIALVHNKAGGIEESVYYTNEGKVFEDKYNLTNLADLHIEVPDNEPQFKPIDKVLVRSKDNTNNRWLPAIYAYYDDVVSHVTIDHRMYADEDCIPYEGNEHLVGTTDKPKED